MSCVLQASLLLARPLLPLQVLGNAFQGWIGWGPPEIKRGRMVRHVGAWRCRKLGVEVLEATRVVLC